MMKTYLDLQYGVGMARKLDIYAPDTAPFDVIVYFHGGGFETGSRKDCVPFAEDLAKCGFAVALADYRMYPEAVFPDFVEDAAAAVAFVRKHIGEYGGSGRIFVGGTSAGAYLSMMLCFDGRYLEKHGMAPTDITAFVHDAGQPTVHFNVLCRERRSDPRRVVVDEMAPLYYVGTQDALPPMLFIVADNDMENRYEQTMLMLSTLRHFRFDMSGIRLKVLHGTHSSYVMETDSRGRNVLGAAVADYIDGLRRTAAAEPIPKE